MSQKFQLEAGMREATGTSVSNKLRRQGIVPGVIYGGDQRTYPVQIDEKEVTDLLKQAHSVNILVDLKVKGAKNENKLVLIQNIQRNTLSGRIAHIDFQAVHDDQPIRAVLPIRLIGEPIGLKLGGQVTHLVHRILISCLPKDLPEYLEFDITHLGVNEALKVKDAPLPKGLSTRLGGNVSIVRVSETRGARAAAVEEKGKKAKDAKKKK